MTTTAHIQTALAAITNGNFVETAADLLATLGYRRESTALWSGAPREFIERFGGVTNPSTQSEKALLTNARLLHILFQLTDAKIQEANAGLSTDTSHLNTGNTRSFLFVAVELSNTTYSRGRYAAFTREINKRWQIPTVVLFKTADSRLTLAFVPRREHKRNTDRDVLGRVSLIREIDTAKPHRAHLDILAELLLAKRLQWISTHGEPKNFDGLLAAWLDALNTEELNRQFYRDLFQWFERAVEEAQFPTGTNGMPQKEEHVIRLITRLLFVWFVKEKGLVAEELFIENQVSVLLKDYDRDTGDSYYRAVLQNLFFATLNTEISTRRFSRKTHDDHRNFSVYRYRSEMADPNGLLELFGRTPFINGGLFDCLDSFDAAGAGGIRIDCFTDNARHRAGYSIPNRLFFDENAGSPGLITLLNRYKFTVEENTPIEQEVALDPELLGKVFENLLAAYNPETRETARRQTGSYYTPRDVVDYMVDEALVAVLAEKAQPDVGGADSWQERLRYLLNYAAAFEDANELFKDTEKENIVSAIAKIKVLDPAVGSGAFPMSILHKLTLVLQRIDPNNKRWESLQKERARTKSDAAFETRDQQERDAELLEISETFERYSGGFGRKLYLIQNSLFGVDIQPVACQIAKLRFFISLAIEQQSSEKATENFGIKPLPNLETRFVATDTLLSLDKPAQMSLVQTDEVDRLEQKLNENRERHFHATTRRKKLAYRRQDARLRRELAAKLKNSLTVSAADQIAQWDPYDQNARAYWFDAEYMFGISGGFDIVIGNPPYIQLQRNNGKLSRLYKKMAYATFAGAGDIYQLFYERGCHLLKERGHLCYITSNKWMRTDYGIKLRRFFVENTNPKILLDFGGFRVFENATVDTNILLIEKASYRHQLQATHFKSDFKVNSGIRNYAKKNAVRLSHLSDDTWFIGSRDEIALKEKIERIGTPLKEWDIAINRGILTGFNKAFIIDKDTKEALIAEDPRSADIIKPVLRGRDIKRYRAEWAGLWLIDTHNGYGNVPAVDIGEYPAIKDHLDTFFTQLKKRQDKGRTPYHLRNCAYHALFDEEKIMYPETMRRSISDPKEFPRFTIDASRKFFPDKTTFIMTGQNLQYLVGILNSKLIQFLISCYVYSWDNNGFLIQKTFVERFAIPRVSIAEQQRIIRLVNHILLSHSNDPTINTSKEEAAIDRLVYEIYGLNENEIMLVESKF